jgi:phage tail-like protein
MANYKTRPMTDPLRNFKFQVQIVGSLIPGLSTNTNMGFTNVSGLSMNTEMVPYREGGWNTNFHKLPGQTDFGPLTLTQGIVYTRPEMWNLAKSMFAVQWGNGTLPLTPGGATTDFRYTTVIRVMDHPVTQGAGSGSPNGIDPAGAKLAFVLYNCWTGSVAFNDLDATGNAVLVSQMTMHHEGFDVVWGVDATKA